MLRVASLDVFNWLWTHYFTERINRLATHPVANFVLAKAIERLDAAQMTQVIQELAADKTARQLIGRLRC